MYLGSDLADPDPLIVHENDPCPSPHYSPARMRHGALIATRAAAEALQAPATSSEFTAPRAKRPQPRPPSAPRSPNEDL